MKIVVILVCSLLLILSGFAQSPGIEKEPSWIAKTELDYSTPYSLNDAEDGGLDIDLEKQVNVGTRETYWKRTIKIMTEAGLENNSEVSVSYDPAYQKVVFHYIKIRRGDEVINKLNLSNIKVIQQETELSRSIYNGSLTSVIFLEDIRKGDIIEYAYSIKGFNPVFNNKYFSTLETQYMVPVKNIYYKVVCPLNRELTIKNSLTDIKPVVTSTSTEKTYEWKLKNVPALKPEDATPAWYDPYPSIGISEFTSWKEVNDWAITLFRDKEPLSPALKKKIDEIRAQGSDQEHQLLTALRFVQDDVRYLGIEMGSNSHKPHHPNKIFNQRFGDCKDKTFLLCTMLQALGIEASPVLINATYGNVINSWLPSPYVFNHATVRANLNNKYYYFDPTISFQRGGIDDISFPDYKFGLVISDTTKELTAIPLQDKGKVVTKEIFTMKDISGAAKLVVNTTYSGSFADEMRSDVNNNSRNELQKNFLNFYSQFYEDTRETDSLSIVDDETTGTLTTHEYYTVDKLWQTKNQINKASFLGLMINSVFKKPKDKERKMPLAIRYPSHYIEEIEVHLPEKWTFDETPTNIKNDAFEFNADISSTENTLLLKYEYKTLQDKINAGDASEIIDDYEKLQNGISYELTKGETGNSNFKEASNTSGRGGNLLKTIFLIVVVTVILVVLRRRT